MKTLVPAYPMVVLAIRFSHLVSFVTHVVLECRIHNQFFSYTVTGQLPGELVAEALLMVMIGRVGNLVIILL